MFEVVVLPSLFLKDMHDDIAIVQGHPATIAPALLAQGLATLELAEPFDLFGDGPYLTVVTTRNDDQGVKGVNQLSAVEDGGVETNLLGSTSNGRFKQVVGRDGDGPGGQRSGRCFGFQCETPSDTNVTRKGTMSRPRPRISQR